MPLLGDTGANVGKVYAPSMPQLCPGNKDQNTAFREAESDLYYEAPLSMELFSSMPCPRETKKYQQPPLIPICILVYIRRPLWGHEGL